jgi:hypothetical protein
LEPFVNPLLEKSKCRKKKEREKNALRVDTNTHKQLGQKCIECNALNAISRVECIECYA